MQKIPFHLVDRWLLFPVLFDPPASWRVFLLRNKVFIPNSVKKDLEEIISYYIDERPDYAKKIFQSISEKICSLKDFPYKGRIVPELLEYNINEYRELIESYWRIFYRIENEIVEIFTIIDSRRNVQDLLIEKLKRKFV